MAANYSIVIDQGATVSRVFTWYQQDGVTPVNLTGFTAHMQVRDEPQGAGNLLADYSTSGGQIALGSTAGTITLTVPAATTAAYSFTSGYYDLHMTDSAGNVTCLLAGLFTVNPAVTVG